MRRAALTIVAAVLALASVPSAQTGTVMPVPKIQFFDNDGEPCAGCLLNAYAAGTTTRQDTYSDAALTTPNENPVELDASGRATVFLSPTSYRFVLTDSTGGTTYWDQDLVSATPRFVVDLDVSGTAGEDLSAGEAVFLSNGTSGTTAGRWYKADADVAAKSSTAGMVGMVPADIDSGATGSIRLQGRITGLSGLSIGSLYYVSTTAGALTSSAPMNGRGVGVADSTSTIVLAPNGGNPAGDFTVGGDLYLSGGDFVGTVDGLLRRGTADAADTGVMSLAGGGNNDRTRGSHVDTFGNEHATRGGDLGLQIGSASGATLEIFIADGTSAVSVDGATGAATIAQWLMLTPRASAPGSPAAGMIYVDSTPTPDELCFYDGAAWQGISSGTDANCS